MQMEQGWFIVLKYFNNSWLSFDHFAFVLPQTIWDKDSVSVDDLNLGQLFK